MVYKIIGVMKFIVVCLMASVVVYLGFLLYVNMTQNDVDLFFFRTSQYTLNTFLSNLHDENTPNYGEHQRLYKVLRVLRKKHLGDIQENSDVPADYQFFFQEVLPDFLRNSDRNVTPLEEKRSLLATFPRDADYTAKLLLITGPDGKILKGKRRVNGYDKRLEMTGTYTSEFNHPTGLFMIDGEVVNPVLQKWEGLVILNASGKLHIKDMNTLEYQFRRFDITHSYQDYLDFMKLAKKLKLSFFQTHLLIKNGEIDVPQESTKRFRRRVIFQDSDYAVSVYDSFDKQLTLYEVADILKTRYNARDAVNLDMGPYGYCARYHNEQRVKLYGGKGRAVQLSNILIFNYH